MPVSKHAIVYAALTMAGLGAVASSTGCSMDIHKLPATPTVQSISKELAECSTAQGYHPEIQGPSVFVTVDVATEVHFTDHPAKLTVLVDPKKTPEDEVAKRSEAGRVIGEKIYACATAKASDAPKTDAPAATDAPSATPSSTPVPES